ncbi:uncharacterized protein ACHE_80648A [Aspergillus chevalieri]|uniref:Uncharacterized protein n=1 Tax=Aspergillus chevalieri TaxID=182096 RepID=A0A7R7ZSC4_ASPCH|nr:uncharacterized protein ACHE_80648A [Aspergillus chevalieri]BCR92748.1 hypothetical protein ACHE_80648A [Aspergillus chevalieri]
MHRSCHLQRPCSGRGLSFVHPSSFTPYRYRQCISASYLLALAAITAAIPFQGQNGATSHKGEVLSIPNLQIPRGKKFIESPASAKPLQHKPVYEPEAINMHQDGGNTGSIDYLGPLGNNPEVTSTLEGLHIFLWTKSGQTVAGYTTLETSGLKWGLAAVDGEMKA